MEEISVSLTLFGRCSLLVTLVTIIFEFQNVLSPACIIQRLKFKLFMKITLSTGCLV